MEGEYKTMGVESNDPAAAAAAPDLPIDLSVPAPRRDEPGGAVAAAPQTFVKKRWLAQSQAKNHFIPLQQIRNAVKRRATEMESFTTTTTTTSSTTEDSTSLQSSNVQHWDLGLRLDRANSVPYLTAPPPLQRHKSLSESRIVPREAAPAAAPAALPLSSTDDKTVRWLLEHQQELQRQRMQHMELLAPEPSEINLNYYTKMVQFMQTQQQLLRAAPALATAPAPAAHDEDDGYDDDDECPELADIDYSSSPSQADDTLIVDEGDVRKRQGRPLTGKHVRSGTGAKPSTLLELRKKIQARQQMKSAALK